MVSTSHPNASELFARDLGGLVKFFAMKMRYVPPPEDLCKLEDIVVPAANIRIDEEVRASGFSKDDDDILMRFIHSAPKEEGDMGRDDDDDDEEEDDEEEEEEEYIKKKKPSKKSVSRVTDFLNSSSSAPNATEDSEDRERDKNNTEAVSSADGQDRSVSPKDTDASVTVPSSPAGLSRDGALNSNQWIPEPRDMALDLDRALLEGGDDADLFSDDDKGSTAILTEEALQRVKDKTRKLGHCKSYFFFAVAFGFIHLSLCLYVLPKHISQFPLLIFSYTHLQCHSEGKRRRPGRKGIRNQ
jgi:hypothetical protein